MLRRDDFAISLRRERKSKIIMERRFKLLSKSKISTKAGTSNGPFAERLTNQASIKEVFLSKRKPDALLYKMAE